MVRLYFVYCTWAGTFSHSDLLRVRSRVSRKLQQPPDRRESEPKPQSDDRWAVTLSGTSHWYSNLLHFLRERTPMWKRSTALGAASFDPLNMKQITDEAEHSTICWSLWTRVKNKFISFLLRVKWRTTINNTQVFCLLKRLASDESENNSQSQLAQWLPFRRQQVRAQWSPEHTVVKRSLVWTQHLCFGWPPRV